MEQKAYKTTNQFETDLEWFAHNCATVFPENEEVQKAAKGIVAYVKDHINIIGACDGCYLNAYQYGKGFVVEPCKKLHLLLWAKFNGYCHWPAKVLAINTESEEVIVQFFGDYTWRTLPAKNCYLYSKENPKKKPGPRPKLYVKALAVSSNVRLHAHQIVILLISSPNFFSSNRMPKNTLICFGQHSVNLFVKMKFLVYDDEQTIFDPEKIEEYLTAQFNSEHPNSSHGASETDSDYMNANLRIKKTRTRKRKVKTASFNGPRAKRYRNDTDFGKMSKLMAANLTQGLQGLRNLNQLNDDNTQKIAQLQRDLAALEQENAALIDEKMVLEEVHGNEKKDLEQKVADAEKAKCEAEEELMDKIKALEVAQLNEKKTNDDEKAALKQRIDALEANKTKNTCANCHNYVDSLVFCNNECLK